MNSFLKRFNELMQENAEEKTHDSKILIFDGLNTFIRVFAATPSLNDNGEHVGGVVGFLRSIVSCVRRFYPTKVIIVFDGKGGSARRRALYKEYKQQRRTRFSFNRYEDLESSEEEEELSFKTQLIRSIQYLDLLPIKILAINDIEADDTIAYISNEYFKKPHQKIIIVSSDKDFIQMVSDRIRLWCPIKKILYDLETTRREYHMTGHNFLLYRCFSGDRSDNIPGVKQVGKARLIKYFEKFKENKPITIDEIINECKNKVDSGDKAKIYQTILNQENTLRLNYELMRLHDVDISGIHKSIIRHRMDEPIQKIQIKKFKKLFVEDNLFSAVRDINQWITPLLSYPNEFAE